tara:strand:+ start:716 stop:1561 length:846 start_codon:yes stop_codon:yes gene_type:complete
MSTKDITIVITSFKSREKIRTCLNSIDKQCRILLIENSDDSSFKKNIENEFINVKCVLTGSNLGYGKANNIGLKRVETKYALIMNPDASLEPSSLKNFFKTADTIQDFAIISPYIQEKKDEKTKTITKEISPILVNNVKGFAMFLNMSEFKNIGFFDENFFIYFEEIDLCKRLINHNKKIYLDPSIKINHLGGQSHDISINKEMELSRNWHWMWSTFNYHKKYKGFFVSFLIVLPKLISAILKFLLYTLFLNKTKKDIYYHRYSGLLNAIMGKSSWYRPKV